MQFSYGEIPTEYEITSAILIQWQSKGGAPACAPPLPMDQNFLNFMQFFGKSGKFVIWRSSPGGWRPLLRGILDPHL